MYKIYADGGCAPRNPGPGGFAFRIEGPDGLVHEGWGFEDPSTNNRMEILAATEGLRRVPVGAEVELICDSQYVLNGCSTWRKGWQSRGMRKADGEPVLNAELWTVLWAEADKRRLKCTWVRGHTGNPGNERVDELAGLARARRETVMPPAVAGSAAALPPAPAPSTEMASRSTPTTAPAAPAPQAAKAGSTIASTLASGSTAATETMLMSLLSVKFGGMLRPDAAPAYKDTAASIVQLLKRLNWTPPA